MQHSRTLDDRLLALDVETALKALGIAAGEDDLRDGDLRLAVADLRGSVPAPARRAGRAGTPALLVDDHEIFRIR